MTVPRCSACDRIAIVEIDDDVFLCKRCETILKREFPNFRAGAKPAEEAAADAEPAPCIAAANQSELAIREGLGPSTSRDRQSGGRLSGARNETASFPDIPKFLRRTAA